MTIIKNRQINPSPEIEYSEIYIPNDSNFGTGTFTTRIKKNSLLNSKLIISAIVNIPVFQLSVNLNPSIGKVPILLGRVDRKPPLSNKTYELPQIIDHTVPHEFVVYFQKWSITSFTIDTIPLHEFNEQKLAHNDFLKKASNMTRFEFFQQHVKLLEKLVSNDWFNKAKNKQHPAYKKWEFCKKMESQNGIIKFPEQTSELPIFAQTLIDSAILITVTEGNLQRLSMGSFDKFTKPVKDKILNSLHHPTQFDDVMLELSFAAWHLMEKHKAEVLETSGYPDVKIIIPKTKIPVFAECKNIKVDKNNRIATEIKKANKQLKRVKEKHYGIAVLNVATPIKLHQVSTDIFPARVNEIISFIKGLLSSNKYRSIGAVILIWDDYIEIGKPPQKTLLAYRRRFIRIDHTPVEGCLSLPRNINLFKGFTSTYSLNWQQRK